MESNDCRRRVPDAEAEQPPQYFVTVKCEPAKVKEEPTEIYRYNSVEEPEWGECSVSEAAAAEGLYAGHQVKDELLAEPELVKQEAIAFSMQSKQDVKTIKEEIVHQPNPAGGTDAASESSRTCPVEVPHGKRNIKETKRKLYSCGTCNQQFITKARFIKHTERHKDGNPHICDICNKQFNCKSKLTAHTQIHTGEKPYSCRICNKLFTQQSNLTRHMWIHKDEKRYSCDICNKRFRQKRSLTNHKGIHTDQTAYSCSVCQELFTSKTALADHMRIHTGEKPYSCGRCKRPFTNTTALTIHVRMHHTHTKSYSCDVCKKLFIRQSHFLYHVHKYHDIVLK